MIEEAGPGPVGVDGLDAVWPPVGQLTRLTKALDDRVQDASELVWRRRLCKSAWEVARMRTAADVLRRAYDRVHPQLKPGLTEREISAMFSIAQLEEGAHEVGPHAVVAGPDRGLFGWPTDKVWQADDLLYLDGAAIVDGYWSDYCRTFAARPVTPHERAGYARTRSGLEAAAAIAAGGRTAAELGTVMASVMDIAPDAVGFGRFGHGIGLHVPEPPSLHAADPTVLEPGLHAVHRAHGRASRRQLRRRGGVRRHRRRRRPHLPVGARHDPGDLSMATAVPPPAWLDDEIDRVTEPMLRLRRDLHAHPELAGAEVRTASIAADHCTALGAKVRTGSAAPGYSPTWTAADRGRRC